MRILALEPFYGGSHRALLDGWALRTRHELVVLTLSAHHWKWRVRHAPLTFAQRVLAQGLVDQPWDALWCSSMLSLAEFRGLVAPRLAAVPAVVYFHENQLAYPVTREHDRDLHFAFTNLTTALAADEGWYNSAHNRDSFLAGLERLLARMPDHRSAEPLERIRARSRIVPPGFDPVEPEPRRRSGPLRLLWAARWEHDKGPETLFAALAELRRRGVEFRVSVIGEHFVEVPDGFALARRDLAAHIDRWGYQQPRAEYEAALRESDVIVSTARHEFFGLSVMEAVSAGCVPVLPDRLVYPELFPRSALYDGTLRGLVDRLVELARVKAATGRLDSSWVDCSAPFAWDRAKERMDAAMDELRVTDRGARAARAGVGE
jgi:glycosyltransferase involved in cell wall biosynthesis